ncbi:MAG: hypothetical protein EXX96DRAFT_606993, partial [Benjaminiella poitrasii]
MLNFFFLKNSIEDLLLNANNDVMFANTVKSSEFLVEFVFNEDKANIDLALENFSLDGIKTTCQAIFLDSGGKSVFTTSIDMIAINHSTARCTTKEHYYSKSFMQYLKRLENCKAKNGIKEMETAIPSLKTSCCSEQLKIDPNYTMVDKEHNKKWRICYLMMEQNMTSKKVFSSELFGKDPIKLKGNKAGVTGVLCRVLKRREAAGDLIVLTISEYKTSRICNECGTDPLASATHFDFSYKDANVE